MNDQRQGGVSASEQMDHQGQKLEPEPDQESLPGRDGESTTKNHGSDPQHMGTTGADEQSDRQARHNPAGADQREG